MLSRVTQFFDSTDNDFLKLFAPDRVKFVNLLILLDGILCEISNEGLGSLCILFSLQPVIFDLLLTVFLAFIPMGLLLNLGRENGRRGQDLIKVLELLSRLVLI